MFLDARQSSAGSQVEHVSNLLHIHFVEIPELCHELITVAPPRTHLKKPLSFHGFLQLSVCGLEIRPFEGWGDLDSKLLGTRPVRHFASSLCQK